MSDQSMDGTERIREQGVHLPTLAHRLWTHWSQHIAEEEEISEERLERWQDLWIPYDELPGAAKDTDRQLVEQFTDETPDYNRTVETDTDRRADQ